MGLRLSRSFGYFLLRYSHTSSEVCVTSMIRCGITLAPNLAAHIGRVFGYGYSFLAMWCGRDVLLYLLHILYSLTSFV